MTASTRTVIVGAGLAGAAAARTLREEGFDGQVTLVGAESHPPYDRPPLSKDYLRGETGRSQAQVEPERYWAEHDVELLTGFRVDRVDLAGRRLELGEGPAIGFDSLLLATGAAPRVLPAPGGQLAGVLTLRSFEDADRIRAWARRAERVLVVGGGWIASEVAASLTALGRSVTLALPGRLPLERTLGVRIAEVYDQLHRDKGVEVLREARVAALEGRGAVRGAVTVSGQLVEADLVVLAIGVAPRTGLARDAGLEVSDGIVVDPLLRTADPAVLAAGDVARVPYRHLGRPLRVEHWGAALSQGSHAARCILGGSQAYDDLPYFFSDQYDTGMEFWGDPDLPGELVVRGELSARSFTAFWHQTGRVRAVLNMHVHHHHKDHEDHEDHEDHDHHEKHEDHEEPSAEAADSHRSGGGHVDPETAKRLIYSPGPLHVRALADPDVPLHVLAGP